MNRRRSSSSTTGPSRFSGTPRRKWSGSDWTFFYLSAFARRITARRFTGNVIHNVKTAVTQLWLANAGLAVLAAGFAIRAHGVRAAVSLLAIGGVMGAAAGYCFIYNIWRTLEGSPPLRRELPTTG